MVQRTDRFPNAHIGHRRDSVILWEGPAAYVRRTGECHEIIVYSSNSVTHVAAGTTDDANKAERVCRGLNAYPRQARAAHGLL